MNMRAALNVNTARFSLLYALALSVAGIDLSITVRSGQDLTGSALGGTFAYVMIALGSIVAARVGMALIHRIGLRTAFVLAGALCSISGVLTSLSTVYRIPLVFYLGLLLVGVFMGLANYHRIVVKDFSAHPSAWDTSIVLLSGIVGAVVGPFLATSLAPTVADFHRAYLVVAVIGLLTAGAALLLPRNVAVRDPARATYADDRSELRLGAIVGMVSYMAMTLVMTAVPLHAQSTGLAGSAIAGLSQAHMVAMYLPILFVPMVIRWSSTRVVAFATLALGAVALPISGNRLMSAMIIAGILWAFGYTAASNMVASSSYGQRVPAARGRAEMLPPLGMIIGSVLAGVLLDVASFAWVVGIAAAICLAGLGGSVVAKR